MRVCQSLNNSEHGKSCARGAKPGHYVTTTATASHTLRRSKGVKDDDVRLRHYQGDGGACGRPRVSAGHESVDPLDALLLLAGNESVPRARTVKSGRGEACLNVPAVSAPPSSTVGKSSP